LVPSLYSRERNRSCSRSNAAYNPAGRERSKECTKRQESEAASPAALTRLQTGSGPSSACETFSIRRRARPFRTFCQLNQPLHIPGTESAMVTLQIVTPLFFRLRRAFRGRIRRPIAARDFFNSAARLALVSSVFLLHASSLSGRRRMQSRRTRAASGRVAIACLIFRSAIFHQLPKRHRRERTRLARGVGNT
jgi:hypothetical protein